MRRLTMGVLSLVGLVVVLIGGMAIVGWCLPREHVAASSAVIAQPPATVWRVVVDHGADPTWRPGLRATERVSDRDGHPAWVETWTAGRPVTLVDEVAEPPRRLVRRVADDAGGGFSGAWEIVLTPDGTGTRVTITERAAVANPVFRCAARFVIGHHRSLDTWLRALGRRFNQGVEPQVADGDVGTAPSP